MIRQLTAKERYEKHEKSGENDEYRKGLSGILIDCKDERYLAKLQRQMEAQDGRS